MRVGGKIVPVTVVSNYHKNFKKPLIYVDTLQYFCYTIYRG